MGRICRCKKRRRAAEGKKKKKKDVTQVCRGCTAPVWDPEAPAWDPRAPPVATAVVIWPPPAVVTLGGPRVSLAPGPPWL